MIRKCQSKEKETIKILKYTLENQKQILDLLGMWGDFDPRNKGNNEIWISNWDGGGILYLEDYVEFASEFYIKTPEEIEQYQFTGEKTEKGFEIWEEKESKSFEFIQWTDNTKEVKEFLGKSGGLDKSGQQFLIMNVCGGDVCNKGDYILKINNTDYFFSVGSEFFNDFYKEI